MRLIIPSVFLLLIAVTVFTACNNEPATVSKEPSSVTAPSPSANYLRMKVTEFYFLSFPFYWHFENSVFNIAIFEFILTNIDDA